MRPVFLHLDDALLNQDRLTDLGQDCIVDARDLGPSLRLWTRPRALDALRQRLRELGQGQNARDIVFCGSGDFHHVTLLLLERALESEGGPATLLHFDNHPDWVKFENGLHCGSWAARAARLPGIARVVTVGPCSKDLDQPHRRGADLTSVEDDRLELYPFRAPHERDALEVCGRSWRSLGRLDPDEIDALVLSRIATDKVYITIDKDVLAPEDAVTNWDQGVMRLSCMLRVMGQVAERHKIIGADVVGDWSEPAYGDGFISSVLKRGEALLDQPWNRPDAQRVLKVNEQTNLRLFHFFRDAA